MALRKVVEEIFKVLSEVDDFGPAEEARIEGLVVCTVSKVETSDHPGMVVSSLEKEGWISGLNVEWLYTGKLCSDNVHVRVDLKEPSGCSWP